MVLFLVIKFIFNKKCYYLLHEIVSIQQHLQKRFCVTPQKPATAIDKMASAAKNYIDDEVVSFFQDKLRCGVFHLDGVDIERKHELVKCLRGFPDFVEFLKNLMFEEDDDMKAIEDFLVDENACLAGALEDIQLAEMEESSEEEDFDEETFAVAHVNVKPVKAAPKHVQADRGYYRERRAEREEADNCLLLMDALPKQPHVKAPKAPGAAMQQATAPKAPGAAMQQATAPKAPGAAMQQVQAVATPFPGQQFCKFYNGCTRKGCLHLHENNCPKWGNCSNARCMERHPQVCKFSKKCRTPGCIYDHSGVEHSQ